MEKDSSVSDAFKLVDKIYCAQIRFSEKYLQYSWIVDLIKFSLFTFHVKYKTKF